MSFQPHSKPTMDPLEHQHQQLERRRHDAEERRLRFHDDKVRTLGVDVDSLDNAIAEKKLRELLQKQEEQRVYKENLLITKELGRLHNNAIIHKRVENRLINDYRKNQYVEPIKEQVYNYEGASSLKKFDGEDPEYTNRKLYQQSQIRQWAESTEAERKALKEQDIQFDKDYAQYIREMDQLEQDALVQKHSFNKYKNKSIAESNADLIAYRNNLHAKNANEAKQRELEDITSQLTSTFLREVPQVSALGPNRRMPDAYKGMSNEEKTAILREQERQILEKQRIIEEQKEEESRISKQAEVYRNLSILKERELRRSKQAQRKEVQHTQVEQAYTTRAHYDNLYRNVYTNKPQESYFDQFGTTDR